MNHGLVILFLFIFTFLMPTICDTDDYVASYCYLDFIDLIPFFDTITIFLRVYSGISLVDSFYVNFWLKFYWSIFFSCNITKNQAMFNSPICWRKYPHI